MYCVARSEYKLLTRKAKSRKQTVGLYITYCFSKQYSANNRLMQRTQKKKKKLQTFRTSSTRHKKIAKKIDVVHYNTITSNRRTGSVFRKENLADISRSEAKHCFFHLVAKVARYIRQVCLRPPGDVRAALVHTIHSYLLAQSFHNINRFYSFTFSVPTHLTP